jgi:hypothetical protein
MAIQPSDAKGVTEYTQHPIDGKPVIEQYDVRSNSEKNDIEAKPGADYSGAVKKTDPREIALVKKLDWRIMPLLWAMYFLNYLDRNAIAQARLNNLEKDLHLKGAQYNTLYIDSFCWASSFEIQFISTRLTDRQISPDASTFEHVDVFRENSTFKVHGLLHGSLGNHIRLYCGSSRLQRTGPCSLLPWSYRGTFLSWRPFLVVDLLHQKRDCY